MHHNWCAITHQFWCTADTLQRKMVPQWIKMDKNIGISWSITDLNKSVFYMNKHVFHGNFLWCAHIFVCLGVYMFECVLMCVHNYACMLILLSSMYSYKTKKIIIQWFTIIVRGFTPESSRASDALLSVLFKTACWRRCCMLTTRRSSLVTIKCLNPSYIVNQAYIHMY